jgi:Kef-type K+ transport system membrane component KefB
MVGWRGVGEGDLARVVDAAATGGLSGEELFARLMLAMAVIILAARVVGIIVARVGQPRVMGEVLAGILLGPTLLGALAGDVSKVLFPDEVKALLGGAADIGLAFYMFLVGLELDPRLLRGRVRQAAIVSNASVAVPMLCGVGLAVVLHDGYAPAGVPLLPFALFLGVSMSITAFPVLARILVERRMLRRPIGALAMAAAAVDDVTAWSLLALASATAATIGMGSEPARHPALVIGLAVLFSVFMATVARRVLARAASAVDEAGHVPAAWLGAIFVGVLLSAAAAGTIGIAPIFGAFVMGLVMPRREALSRDVAVRIEDFVSIVLLPLFFAVAGLKADILMLRDVDLIGLTLVLVGVAIAAKFLTAAAAARLTGMGGRESLAIGALMNTRGLTELIVLSIGLDKGVIGADLYTMLVVMALVTTFMTGPLLRLIDPRGELTSGSAADELADEVRREPAPAAAPLPERAILVVALVGHHLRDLLTVAGALARSEPRREVIAVRLLEPGELAAGVAELNQRRVDAEAELAAARAGGASGDAPLRTAVLTSPSPARDLVRLAGPERIDILLVDGRRSLRGGVLGGPIRSLLEEAPSDVAVLVRRRDRAVSLEPGRPIVVPFGGAEHDWAALELAAWLAGSAGTTIRLVAVARPDGSPDSDPGRLLATTAVVLQQLTGVVAETRVVEPGPGVLASADDAAVLVVGLSGRWREEGLGEVRTRLAEQTAAPVLFVRRGARPGALAPRDDMTRFTWSFAGAGGPPGAGSVAQPDGSGASNAVPSGTALEPDAPRGGSTNGPRTIDHGRDAEPA